MRSPVVVTGAAGRLGSRLVPWLEGRGREVIPVDLVALDHPRAQVDDITQDHDRPWLSGAAAVVHLAGNPSPDSTWDEVEGPNINGTRNIVSAVKRYGVPHLVFASSVWTMRDRWDRPGLIGTDEAEPGDRPYALSKVAGEAIVTEAVGDGLTAVILRIGGRMAGDPRPRDIKPWERSVWVGWDDFLRGMECAIDAEVDRVATVYLVSDNRGHRWDLEPGRRLIGYRSTQHFTPEPPPSLWFRARRKLSHYLSKR